MIYTANYTRIDSGFMGQLIEWPEVVTEAESIEDCRAMLKDAAEQMILAYQMLGKPLPIRQAVIEKFELDYTYVS